MASLAKNRAVSFLLALAALFLAGFWLLERFDLSWAQNSAVDDWKEFAEDRHGFSILYPQNWAFDISYDNYSSGLLAAKIENKKCEINSSQCAAGCVDIRMLSGKKNLESGASALLVQLYENFMMVRDFPSAPLVQIVDIGGKKVFKVADEQATLALNGNCPGPLYVFETQNHFVYVFVGNGADAGALIEVDKIIGSINVD